MNHNNNFDILSSFQVTLRLRTTLRSHPLSCTAALVGILRLSVFLKDATARYAQCGHRINNLTIR